MTTRGSCRCQGLCCLLRATGSSCSLGLYRTPLGLVVQILKCRHGGAFGKHLGTEN